MKPFHNTKRAFQRACWALAMMGVSLLLTGCSGEAPSHSRPVPGAVAMGRAVSLDVYAEGDTLHVLYAAGSASVHALHYVSSEDGGETWSAPVRVDAGAPPYQPHRGNDPQIAASGDHLVAVWTTRGNGYNGRGPLATGISTDGGKTWVPGPRPTQSFGGMDQGFADLTADHARVFHLVWLDARTGEKGLQYARSADGGRTWSETQTIDSATCMCCWNTIKVAPDGRLFVLYRDKNPRDMALAVSADGGRTWERDGRVGRFGWDFEGCPHVGGGLGFSTATATGYVTHAVVWTGERAAAGSYHFRSEDGSRSWTGRTRLGAPEQHHPDLAIAGEGAVVVVWDQFAGGTRAVFYAVSRDDGRTWTAPGRLSAADASATHPKVLPVKGGIRVFWTERKGKVSTWNTERIRLSAF